MARKARVEFERAVYHVLDRGDRREAIFGDDAEAGQIRAQRRRVSQAAQAAARSVQRAIFGNPPARSMRRSSYSAWWVSQNCELVPKNCERRTGVSGGHGALA